MIHLYRIRFLLRSNQYLEKLFKVTFAIYEDKFFAYVFYVNLEVYIQRDNMMIAGAEFRARI